MSEETREQAPDAAPSRRKVIGWGGAGLGGGAPAAGGAGGRTRGGVF
ncbi:hypothetical protein ACFQ7J_37775 [Streptomyces sp. NPDC056501]